MRKSFEQNCLPIPLLLKQSRWNLSTPILPSKSSPQVLLSNMAKKRGKLKGGPYLAAALFCESVIQDKADDALSAIRIVDSINVLLATTAAPDFPSQENPLAVSVAAVLSF